MQARTQFFTWLLTFSIRVLGLCGRFLLAIYLAKYLDVEAVGAFGLIAGAVGIGPSILGLGLNYILNREIVTLPLNESGHRIRDRLVISSLIAGAATLVTFGVLASFTKAATSTLLLTAGILWLEIVAFDFHMSLISLHKALAANVLLFLRSASWVFPFVLVGLVERRFRNLDAMLIFWTFGLIANFIAMWWVVREWPWREINSMPSDWAWFVQRVRKSIYIYFSDLANIATQYLDRFVLAALLGLETTGIFIFFWSFANAVQLLTSSSVIQVATPNLIKAAHQPSLENWQLQIRSNLKKISAVGIGMSIFIFAAVWGILPFLGRQELTSHWMLFIQLLAASYLRCLAEFAANALYSLGLDRSFAISNVFGAVSGTILTLVGIAIAGIHGIGIAALAAAVLLLTVRVLLASRGARVRALA